MITFLSGGTGTPKLLRGMRELLDDRDVAVIVNTAEDTWLSGNHLSPDIDTVMYLFAGILDTNRWWGIKSDSYITHDLLARLGIDEYIAVGDQDRAIHVARGEMLRDGIRLTEATAALCRTLGVRATVLPMTDSVVTTYVRTPRGELHFQEYWVKHRGDVAIDGVVRRFRQPPAATEEVVRAIEASDAVVIGPSNPVTSISPILECAGVREALRRQRVIAVSPFIGDTPVSGPAAALMQAFGKEASSAGTYALYKDFMDVFIQDTRDPVELDGALRLDTLMVNRGKSLDLAKNILTLIYGC
ncbi:2-phospho-L-lactate transferase [Methanoculleus sp. YWC-01]|jgi:LPPG:FO 2-phospho-L-lactate transferase|uniref:2-phospho-L-lactate transferase n=1 Tax=Methanoculleus nereidis TaxID=2735141 RepID=A0ABU3Z1R0_9EURY|nr:2-phospho-L-lactate transferase [Methanoculleus sp. YWC-01]MCK9298528.1 2-phospho-L-lactate transferase [Methanoculleus sp.]MDV4342757.1 2-phospho-L-lactate transferase [Methanoculleus sp. YWC-01]